MFHMGATHNCMPQTSRNIPWWGRLWNTYSQAWTMSTRSRKFSCRREGERGISNLTLFTPVIHVFCNGPPHYQHELTQLSSKIFRHVHHSSAVHVHERSMHFLNNKMQYTFSLTVHTSGRHNGGNYEKIVYQDSKGIIFIQFFKSMVQHVFQSF